MNARGRRFLGTYWCRWLERRINTAPRLSPVVLTIKPRGQKFNKNIIVHYCARVLGLTCFMLFFGALASEGEKGFFRRPLADDSSPLFVDLLSCVKF